MKKVTNVFQKFLLTCCLILAISQVAQATIKYVKPTSSGTGDGSSWANASDDLQAMINAAGSGDEVWVATGTYLPTRDISGNSSPAEPRNKTFFIDKDIEIYGGFPNTGDPGMADRDWKTYHTILSGDLNGDDVPGLSGSNLVSDPSRGDNAYSVVFTRNVSSDFVLDGFYIKDGNASISSTGDYKSPARSGGGWYNEGSPTIKNCFFQSNSCRASGGTIFNNANNGGIANPSYSDCSFLNSYSNNTGGTVFNNGTSGGSTSPTFTNCSFANTSSPNWGGTVVNYAIGGVSNPSFVNCSFANSNSGVYGGTLYNGSDSGGTCNPSYTNCTFTNSHAGDRGGVAFNRRSTGTNPSTCNPIYTNCIFWGSTAANTGTIFYNLNANVTVNNSLVEDVDCTTFSTNSNGGITCNGNMLFNQDPLFVDAANGDLHLQPCSPAIDAGTATNVQDDLDGNPRPFPGTAVDMGAYEYQSILSPTITCPANVTADVDAGICCATLSIAAPTGEDNCSTLTFSNDYNRTNDASDVYFPGETIVTWTATNGLGNTFTCQHSVTVEDNEPPVLGYTDEVCYTEYEVCLDEQAAYTAQQMAELEIFIANCNGDPACLQEAAGEALKIDENARKLVYNCLIILNGCEVIPAVNNQLPDIVVEAPAGSCEIELNPGPVVMENCATFTLTNDFNSNGTGEGTYPVGTTVVTWTAVDQYGNTSTVSRSITVIGEGDADCDGVSDGCDICPGGDDSVDANGDGIPDCSQLLDYEDYSPDWKCGNNKLFICHVDEFGNRRTLCVNKNALLGHLSHGDWAGPCQNCDGQNLVAPNKDGIGTIAAHAELNIFPNPANGEVRVIFERHAPVATLRITDVLGRVVYEKELGEGVDRMTIDLNNSQFENGLYLVSLLENGETNTKQLVVLQ
ncbi:MAG: choice-of-anchor Q domain-containing protein [Saprospiraceae bacterium]